MIRVYSQRHWPGVGKGPLDDCWVLAPFMAVHAVASWLPLPGVKRFRELAGRPDSPTLSNGGNENHMARGIRGIAPKLAIEVANQMPWDVFRPKAKRSGGVALILDSDRLPAKLQFGFAGPDAIHAVFVEWNGVTWRILNPLDKPHSAGDPITQADLRRAVEGHDPKGVHAVLMPTAAVAFTTHPLYVPPAAPGPDCGTQVTTARETALAEGFENGVSLAGQAIGDAVTTALAALKKEG